MGLEFRRVLSDLPVGCGSNHFEHSVFRDDVTEEASNDNGVVDNQDTDGDHLLTRQA